LLVEETSLDTSSTCDTPKIAQAFISENPSLALGD